MSNFAKEAPQQGNAKNNTHCQKILALPASTILYSIQTGRTYRRGELTPDVYNPIMDPINATAANGDDVYMPFLRVLE